MDIRDVPSWEFLGPKHVPIDAEAAAKAGAAEQESEDEYAALLQAIQSEEDKAPGDDPGPADVQEDKSEASLGPRGAEAAESGAQALNVDPDAGAQSHGRSTSQGHEEQDFEAPVFRWTLQAGSPEMLEDLYFDIDTNSWQTWGSLGQLGLLAGTFAASGMDGSAATS